MVREGPLIEEARLKTNTLLLLGLLAVVAYYLSTEQKTRGDDKPPADKPPAAAGDEGLFGGILGTVKSIFDTVGKFANDAPSNT